MSHKRRRSSDSEGTEDFQHVAPHSESSDDFELVHKSSVKGFKPRTKLKDLLNQLSANEELQIVMVGLKGAGKTTIMEKLNPSGAIASRYDDGVGMVEYNNIKFTFWDVGVQAENQTVWALDTPGLIFVVDSNDRDRVVVAKGELHRILNEDLPNPMVVAEITDNLSLNSLGQRLLYIQPSCAISEEGLFEGLNWLLNNIANKITTDFNSQCLEVSPKRNIQVT